MGRADERADRLHPRIWRAYAQQRSVRKLPIPLRPQPRFRWGRNGSSVLRANDLPRVGQFCFNAENGPMPRVSHAVGGRGGNCSNPAELAVSTTIRKTSFGRRQCIHAEIDAGHAVTLELSASPAQFDSTIARTERSLQIATAHLNAWQLPSQDGEWLFEVGD